MSSKRSNTRCCFVILSALIACGRREPGAYDVQEKTVAALQADLAAGRVTSERLVALYLARIAALDASGPALHSVLSLNPRAVDAARALDAERAQGKVRGPFHGIPIVVKDNIETGDRALATTAGSLALADNISLRDATVVARLRAAGAIILGKTNLSEWANLRSTHATSGWSALGGLTKNPYALERNACGSSSGSGVAVAANLAALGLGTETDGSITCPASVAGLVGLKPTVGLVSRSRIIPITTMQDTAGPMTRSVQDAALVLQLIAGPDATDPATRDADMHVSDYLSKLSKDALKGRRLGIMKFHAGFLPAVDKLFARAVAELTAAGASISVIDRFDGLEAINKNEMTVMLTDFREELNAYLAQTPPSVKVRSLSALVAFNQSSGARELAHFDQDLFTQSDATATHDPTEYARLREGNREAAKLALDHMLAARSLDALIAPTVGPAWTSDFVNGDHVLGGSMTLPAVAGYPHLTVPMGQVEGLPVGLSFIGPAWSEATLLALGYAYEQRSHQRQPPPLTCSLPANP
jgi:amidase